MDDVHLVAEKRIRAAQEEGQFDNLPGKGRPLDINEDSYVPEDLRLMFKILRNAGCLPIEMEMRKEIYNVRQLLHAAIDEETRRELCRELNSLLLKESLLTTTGRRKV